MREKLLWMKFNFYSIVGDICIWLSQKTIDARKDIYFEITGKEI